MNKQSPIPPSSLPTGQDTSAAAAEKKKPLRQRSPVLAHLRTVLFAGLLTAIPLFITIFILGIFYGFFTQYTQAPADWIVDHLFVNPATATGPAAESTILKALRAVTSGTFAIILALLIVYILGLLGSFFIGRQILAQIEHFIENLPLIKGIYGTTKQVMAVFRQSGGGSGFQRVVLVQFPREGTWTVAFVTNTIHDAAVRPPTFVTPTAMPAGATELPTVPATGRLVCCFIPMTPNPTSGFFQMFPEEDVRSTDWTVDMGIKIVLSGGLLAPPELQPGK
jgi:uncharacterized membrane protein